MDFYTENKKPALGFKTEISNPRSGYLTEGFWSFIEYSGGSPAPVIPVQEVTGAIPARGERFSGDQSRDDIRSAEPVNTNSHKIFNPRPHTR